MADYASPCNRICTVDPVTNLCIGCFRTLDEISFWTRYTDAERAAIWAELERRKRDFEERSSGG
jgi:uncharacterized protein